jgi:hypothetical protein
MGSMVDVAHGSATLTLGLPSGSTQTGRFYDGVFRVTQMKNGRSIEALVGGSRSGCPRRDSDGDFDGDVKVAHTTAAGAHKHRTTVIRKLWGSAHGAFTTKGQYGSAAVRGTIWLTEDRCDGTEFVAVKDSITVVSFAHPHRLHIVLQGHRFFVPAPDS